MQFLGWCIQRLNHWQFGLGPKGANSTMKVSIIIPVYNVEKYVEKCIQSLINQSYKNDYEK